MGNDTPLVTPFVGERYADSRALSGLIAPPYDVISLEQRRRLAADPHNIVHLILPEVAGQLNRYRAAAERLAAWRSDGVFAVDPAPAVYVVAQTFTPPGLNGNRHTRVGMFAAVAAEPYETRRVLPHERTHRSPKVDRLELLRATRTNLESIFLLAPDADGRLAQGMRTVSDGGRAPEAKAELDGVEIRVWVVTGVDAERLATAAGAHLYIADGHHRYETAVTYAQENPAATRLLAFIASVRDPGLVVLPTHRVIYAADRDVVSLEPGWRRFFELTPVAPEADRIHLLADAGHDRTACIVATEGGQRDLLLRLRADAALDDLPELGRTAAVRTLDVAIVERLVVQEILAAGKSTPTLTYTPDSVPALQVAHLGKAVAAVLLNPTRVEQVLAVADAGDVMPPKSTYFVPKVPSGLVVRRVEG